MKNINKFAMIVSIITVSTSFIAQASNFELYNKSNQSVNLIFGMQGQNIRIEPGQIYSGNMYVQEENVISVTPFNEVNKNIFIIKRSNPGMSVYLTWDPTKAMPLYPQTGALMGLAGRYNPFGGKTKGGQDMENNVTENEIRKFY